MKMALHMRLKSISFQCNRKIHNKINDEFIVNQEKKASTELAFSTKFIPALL